MRRFALLGHPGSRRTLGFVTACEKAGIGAPRLICWEELLSSGFDPAREFADVDVLRVETPADNPAAERLLLARGAAECRNEGIYQHLPKVECEGLPDDDGRLRYQRQWYFGFCRVLCEISRWCREYQLRPLNSPAEIALLFDKERTRAALAAQGVPIPSAAGICDGFDDLVSRMDAAGWNRVFLKPCHGSSAAGVIAISRSSRGQWRAITSAVVESRGLIRNSKQVRLLRKIEPLRRTVDAVCRERALVERWFPKATLGGRVFDLRVITIAGGPAHVAVRTSLSPITNLHLANRRGDLSAVVESVGPDLWRKAMDTAAAAARCFPGCHYMGVDLMIGASRRGCAVAEVNAFGDLLHRELWQGLNPWEAELALWPDASETKSGAVTPD